MPRGVSSLLTLLEGSCLIATAGRRVEGNQRPYCWRIDHIPLWFKIACKVLNKTNTIMFVFSTDAQVRRPEQQNVDLHAKTTSSWTCRCGQAAEARCLVLEVWIKIDKSFSHKGRLNLSCCMNGHWISWAQKRQSQVPVFSFWLNSSCEICKCGEITTTSEHQQMGSNLRGAATS